MCGTYIAIAVAVAALAATVGAYYSTAYGTDPTAPVDPIQPQPHQSGLGKEIDDAIAHHDTYPPTVCDLIGAACYGVFRFAVPEMPDQTAWDNPDRRCVATAVDEILGTNPIWNTAAGSVDMVVFGSITRSIPGLSCHASQRWVVYELTESQHGSARVHVTRFIARDAHRKYSVFTALSVSSDIVYVKGSTQTDHVLRLIYTSLGGLGDEPPFRAEMQEDVLRNFVCEKLLDIDPLDKTIKIQNLVMSELVEQELPEYFRSICEDADIGSALQASRGFGSLVMATRVSTTGAESGDTVVRLTMLILNTVDENPDVVTECMEIEIQTGEYECGHVTVRSFPAEQFSSKYTDRVATMEYRLDETMRRVDANNTLLPVYPPKGIFTGSFSGGIGPGILEPWDQNKIDISFKVGVATAGVWVIGGGFLGAVASSPLLKSAPVGPALTLSVWPEGDKAKKQEVKLKKGVAVRMPLITGLLCTWSAASASLSVPTVVGTYRYTLTGGDATVAGTIAVTGNVMFQNPSDATREVVVGKSGEILFNIFTTEEHKERGMVVKQGKFSRLYMNVTHDMKQWYNAEEAARAFSDTIPDMADIGFGIAWDKGESVIKVTYAPKAVGAYACNMVLIHAVGGGSTVVSFTVTCISIVVTE